MPISVYRGSDGKARYADETGREYSPAEALAQNEYSNDTASIAKQAFDAVSNYAAELPNKVELAMKHAAYEQLDANYHYYKDSDADRNTDLQSAARFLGIAVETIEGARTDVQDEAIKRSKGAKVLTGDDIANFPVLSEMLRDPTIMSQSFDDLDALADLEKNGGVLSDAYNLAEATQELNDIDYAAMKNEQKLDELDYDTMLRRKQLLARIALLEDRNKKDPYFMFSLTNMLTDTGFDAVKSVTNIADSKEEALLAVQVGAIAGSLVPGLGTAAGAASGFLRYLALATAIRAGKGAAAAQYRNLSVNHSIEDAKLGANITGGLTGAFNLPFFGGVLSNYLMKAATKTGLAKRMAVNTAENFGLGAAMGAAQVAGTKVADGEISFNAQDAQIIAEGGMSLAALGGLMSLPGYSWAGIHALGEKVGNSKLAKRNPALVERLIDGVQKDESGRPFSVSLNAKRFYDYLASLDPEDAKPLYDAFSLTPERLQFLVESGGDVSMTLGQILTRIDEKHRDALSEDIKVNGQMSFRELADMAENGEAYAAVSVEDLIKREEGGDTKAELADIKKELETEIDRDVEAEVDAEPLYIASDMLEGKMPQDSADWPSTLVFDLQRFGHKEAKLTAKDYIEGKLSPEAMEAMEAVAQANGFSSAAELASAVLNNDTKAGAKTKRKQKRLEEALTEIGLTDRQMALEFTEERLRVNDENIQKVAEEQAALEEEARNIERDTKLDELEAGDVTETPELLDEADKIAAQYETIAKESDGTASEGSGKQTRIEQLRERIKELKAEQKEVLRETKADLKEQARDKMADLKDKQREKTNELREKQSEKVAELRKKYGEIIKELRAEMKDNEAKRAARRSEWGKNQVKEAAKQELARTSLKEALDWKTFLKRADEARRKAEVAYSKYVNSTPDVFIKDGSAEYRKHMLLQTAIAEKNREIKLRAMAQESLRYRGAVSKLEREFKRDVNAIKNDRKNANKGKYTATKTDESFNAVGGLLEKFGILAPDSWKRQPSTDANFAAYVNRMNNNLGIMRIPDWILKAIENPETADWQGLTLQQAIDVSNALKNVKQAANLENRLLTSEHRETVAATRDTLMAELGQVKKKDWRGEKKNWLKNMWRDQYTFDTIISNLFGDNSKMHDIFIKRKWALDNKERAFVQKYDAMYRALWDKYTAKEQRLINSHKIFIEELGIDLTKRQLMTIALNMGNEGNIAKLFPQDKSKIPIDVQGMKNPEMWNPQNVMRALSNNLDAKDWQTVQGIWSLLDDMTPDLVAHEKARTGFTPEMVQGTPFKVTLKDGTTLDMKGGYYPLTQDIRSGTMLAKESEADTLADMLNRPKGLSQTNHGFMKQRTNAEYEVSLDPSLLARHIRNVGHDLYFRDYVSDLARITKTPEFETAIKDALGMHGRKTMGAYLNQIVGEAYFDAGYDAMYQAQQYLRKAMATNAIALNFRVIVQNLANLPLYVGAVDGFGVKDMLHAIGTYGLPYWTRTLFDWRGHEKYLQENLSPFMLELFRQPDTTFRRLDSMAERQDKGVTGIFGDASAAVADFSAHLMWMTDSFASVPMWLEMYHKTLAETGDKVAAMEKADMLIRRVNGSANKADQSLFIRDDKGMYSFLNMFMGFFNTEFNRWAREMSRFTDKPIQATPRTLAFIASRVLLFNLASELLMGEGPEEDESVGRWAARKAITYPMTLSVMTKDVGPTAVNRAFGADVMPFRGSALLQPLSSTQSAYNAVGGFIDEPTGENAERAAQNATGAAMYWLHLPKWFWSLSWNAYDWSVNDMSFQTGDLFVRRPRKERGE